jgi:hypothetical protein
VIVWLNGTHGAGKTTTSALVQQLIPGRIQGDTLLGPSTFRVNYLESYAEAARTWLHDEAEVIDTTHLTPAQAPRQIADAVQS